MNSTTTTKSSTQHLLQLKGFDLNKFQHLTSVVLKDISLPEDIVNIFLFNSTLTSIILDNVGGLGPIFDFQPQNFCPDNNNTTNILIDLRNNGGLDYFRFKTLFPVNDDYLCSFSYRIDLSGDVGIDRKFLQFQELSKSISS